jgi:hypothetical protein
MNNSKIREGLQEKNAAQVLHTGGSVRLQTHRPSHLFTEVQRRNRGDVPAPLYKSGNCSGVAQPLLDGGTAGHTATT